MLDVIEESMYIFSDDEWILLTKLFKNYEDELPVILQDFMNTFLLNHNVDKEIKYESELIQIINFLNLIYDEIYQNRQSENENINDKSEFVKMEDVARLKRILNEIIILLSAKRNEEMQNCEERNEYK